MYGYNNRIIEQRVCLELTHQAAESADKTRNAKATLHKLQK